jgi:hypothetical protein
MRCTLMHKTIPVADMTLDDTLGVILSADKLHSETHLPVGIPVTDGLPDYSRLTKWWVARSISGKRAGLRPVLEKLNIPVALALVKECCGFSLSDQYWIRPENSELRWADTNLFDNGFSGDVGNMLFGRPCVGTKPDLLSPDSTTDGRLMKRWEISGSKRRLIKGGCGPYHQEPLNEVITSAICRRLRIPHAEYTLLWENRLPFSVCEDFIAPGTELVSAFQICETKPFVAGGDLYEHFLDCCNTLGIPGMRASLDQMLAVDFLIANADRHYGNFGAIRNADTLEWIGPAPLFDNGTSLWCDTASRLIDPDADTKSVTFYQSHADQLDLVTTFGWLDMTALDGIDEEYDGILAISPFIDEERRDSLCQALMRRVEMLGEIAQTMEPENGMRLL